MADVYITDIPEPVFEKLEERARTSGRTVNEELLEIVGTALARRGEKYDELKAEPRPKD